MAESKSTNMRPDLEDDVLKASGRLEALGFMMQQAAAGPHEWDPGHLHVIGSMVCEYSEVLNKAFYEVLNAEAVNG